MEASSAPNPFYAGGRLNPTTREIRLLTIHPGDSGSPVSCSVTKACLGTDKDLVLRFNALSYVWGDPTVTEPIYIDGLEVLVTVNLKSALRHIRDFFLTMSWAKDLPVWADAVCS